tara:strand:- start:135 stop:698 length:564 start_codon:yes stop_codon:yes gene_type:complete
LFIPGTVFALALVLAVALSTPGATPWCNTTAFSVDTGTRRILGTRCIYMNQYSTINVFGARSRGRVGRDLHEQWGGPGLLGLAEMYMKQEKKSKCASKQRGHHLMERGGARSKKKREVERRRGGEEEKRGFHCSICFFLFSFRSFEVIQEERITEKKRMKRKRRDSQENQCVVGVSGKNHTFKSGKG